MYCPSSIESRCASMVKNQSATWFHVGKSPSKCPYNSKNASNKIRFHALKVSGDQCRMTYNGKQLLYGDIVFAHQGTELTFHCPVGTVFYNQTFGEYGTVCMNEAKLRIEKYDNNIISIQHNRKFELRYYDGD